jgi:hypothetical protein
LHRRCARTWRKQPGKEPRLPILERDGDYNRNRRKYVDGLDR